MRPPGPVARRRSAVQEFADVPLTRSAFVRLAGRFRSRASGASGAFQRYLAHVRRGSFSSAAVWSSATPENRRLLRVMAASDAARGEPVLLSRVGCARPGDSGRRWRAGTAAVHSGAGCRPSQQLRSGETTPRHRWHRGSPRADLRHPNDEPKGRTLVDLCAQQPFVSGVSAVEHILHTDGLEPEQLRAGAPRSPTRSQVSQGRGGAVFRGFALGLARRQPMPSPFRRAFGFPQPQQQREYVGSAGQNFSVDFCRPEFDVICEADSRAKDRMRDSWGGRVPQQALWEE